MSPLRLFIALGLLTALAVPIAGAGAQASKPTPCTGLLLKDGKGDQTKAPVGGGSAGLPYGSTGPENIDIRGLFWNYAPGADGKKVLTAHVQIHNLTAEVPAEAREGEVRYLVDFATQGNVAFLTVKLTKDGFSYIYGEVTDIPDPGGGVQILEKETKGAAALGPDGVLSIEMPESAGIKEGTEMTGVITRVSLGDNTVVFVSDQSPDGGVDAAVKFKVASCPAPGAPAAPTPTTPVQPGTPGSPTQPTPGQPAQGALPVGGPLSISVAVDKGKRATARKRGLRARLSCTVQCKATGVASIDAKTAKALKLGKKAMVVGKGSGTITKPGRVPFFIKLNAKTKKALGRKRVKKFGLKVAFTVTDLQGKQPKKSTKKSTLR